MVGVSRIEIKENAADLKQLMHEQKSASAKERLHSLYLLKTQHTSITEVAELLGRHRVTVQRWLQEYEQGGLNALLAQPVRQGPPSLIPETVQVELVAKLSTPQGFGSYGEIQAWLADEHDVELTYSGVHKHVHYKLKADLKQPRPVSLGQEPQRVSFLKRS